MGSLIDIWSIDFLGIDEAGADRTVDGLSEFGLAKEPMVSDPEVFLTLHMDVETVEAVLRVLQKESEDTMLDTVVSMLREWLDDRKSNEPPS